MQPLRRPFILLLTAIFLLGASVPFASAQSNDQQNDRKHGRKKESKKDEQKAASPPTTANPTVDPKLYGAMKWRLIGPFRGGRVLSVTGVTSQPNTYYMGAVAGGVWKTTDGGITWDPMFEKQSVSSIGAIAVSESDPNVVYAGTGEACIRGNISFGDGVYRSNDGGKTWTNIGLKDSRHIGKLIVHPANPDTVFVAALGHAYGANTERGIFRTARRWKNLGKSSLPRRSHRRHRHHLRSAQSARTFRGYVGRLSHAVDPK